jgi:uncharacterized protein (TIGR02996 family)
MTDETALIAAICARPDDDTPRLVYADWLDDHGWEDRADFIRDQIALSRTGGLMGKKPRIPVMARVIGPVIGDMLEAEGGVNRGGSQIVVSGRGQTVSVRGWRANTYQSDRPGSPLYNRPHDRIRVYLNRGFPAEIVTDAASWVRYGDALSWHTSEPRPCPVTACPGVRVTLTTPIVEGVWSGLLTRPRAFAAVEQGRPGRAFNVADIPGDPAHGSSEAFAAALALRWPGVREWHLPDTPRTHQYSHRGRAAAAQ